MKEKQFDLDDIIKDCEFFNQCCELYDKGFTEIFKSAEWKNHLR